MILIVSNSIKSGELLTDMFHYMGFLARCTTASEALTEASAFYRAVIVVSPSELYSAEDFCKQIKNISRRTPIFALLKKGEANYENCFDGYFENSTYAAEIIRKIIDFTSENRLPTPGSYKLSALELSVNLTVPMYATLGLPFTKTECMILKYLIRCYPSPTTAEDILLHAYRPTRLPDAANIRTHLSSINKKFRAAFGRNLVSHVLGEGYVIETHERVSATV